MSTAQKNREPTTLVFIRVVAAVVVIVTLPAPWNAPVVLAAELVWLTRSLVWVSHRHSKHKTVTPPRPPTFSFPPAPPSLSRFSPHSSFGSSEASPQSSSPSHFQRAGMQRPESLQRNSSTPHVIWAAINVMDKARWWWEWDRSRCFYNLIDFKKGNIMQIIVMRAKSTVMWC